MFTEIWSWNYFNYFHQNLWCCTCQAHCAINYDTFDHIARNQIGSIAIWKFNQKSPLSNQTLLSLKVCWVSWENLSKAKSLQLKLFNKLFPRRWTPWIGLKRSVPCFRGWPTSMKAQSTGNLCGTTSALDGRWRAALEKTFCLVRRIKLVGVVITTRHGLGYATQLNQISLFTPTHRCHCFAFLSRTVWHTFEFRSMVTNKAMLY